MTLRLILSYHFFAEEDFDRAQEALSGFDLDLMADSGAYSAWSAGVTIDLDAYSKWLERWGDRFSAVAALDVIGDAEASFQQTLELRRRFPSLPIMAAYHSNDVGGFDYLKRYIDAGFDYIGISPVGRLYANRPLLKAWVKGCFDLRPKEVRYHGFGVSSWSLLKAFPWYSVDTSTWTSVFRYKAGLYLFDEGRRRFQIMTREPKVWLKHRTLLADYGLRAKDLHWAMKEEASISGERRSFVRGLSLEAWQRAERWLNIRGNALRMYLGIWSDDLYLIRESFEAYRSRCCPTLASS